MKPVPGVEGKRRLNPRIWDYNYYIMCLQRRAYQDLIDAHLPSGGLARLVDLGCGTKPYQSLFAGHVSEYIGVDLADNPQADLTVMPGESLPLPDAAADVVLSTQVLEHIVDVDSYLRECHRLLKPGGLLILSTHGFWLYHPYPTDVRRWTCWGLKYEIEKHGFRVESQQGCLGPFAYATLLHLQMARGVLYQAGKIALPFLAILTIAAQYWMMAKDFVTPRKIRAENSAVYVVGARKIGSC